MCAQISVSGRFLSMFDPPGSSKVSFSLERGAHLHIFSRSPFFWRRGPRNHQNESKSDPKIGPKSAKTRFLIHRFVASFSASISDKKLQNWIPNFAAKRLFGHFWGCCFSHPIFGIPKAPCWGCLGFILMPQGSILEPFWVTCLSWRLKFGATYFDIYSFRFCSIHKNLPCLIPSFLSGLWKHLSIPWLLSLLQNILHIASTPTPKTSKNISSIRLSQKLPDPTH